MWFSRSSGLLFCYYWSWFWGLRFGSFLTSYRLWGRNRSRSWCRRCNRWLNGNRFRSLRLRSLHFRWFNRRDLCFNDWHRCGCRSGRRLRGLNYRLYRNRCRHRLWFRLLCGLYLLRSRCFNYRCRRWSWL